MLEASLYIGSDGKNLICTASARSKASLFSGQNRFYQCRNPGKQEALKQLVGCTQEGYGSVTSWIIRRFPRLEDSDDLRLSPGLRDNFCRMDMGEKSSQPVASLGTKVLQKFRVDPINSCCFSSFSGGTDLCLHQLEYMD